MLNAAQEEPPSSCPVPHEQRRNHPMLNAAQEEPPSSCPVPHEQRRNHPMLNARNMMPAADQRRAAGQRVPLSTRRAESTIPKGEVTPKHQSEGADRWVYPSPQMFYNAMRRKGWEPSETDMDRVVAIHNTVNEHSWRGVLEWESLHRCEDADAMPRLLKFKGLAQQYSPRARLRSLFGYALPFDRHDWIVERCGGRGGQVRYIIDFYTGEQVGGKPLSMHVDVRPALDSVGAFVDRFVRMPWRKYFSSS